MFVPLLALSGIEGRVFAPLGLAYIISILASLVVSITLTPVLAYYLLPGIVERRRGEGRFGAWLKRGNRALLEVVFRVRETMLALACIGVALAGLAAAFLPRAFLPPFNEGTLTVNATFQPGISLAESSRVIQNVRPGETMTFTWDGASMVKVANRPWGGRQ